MIRKRPMAAAIVFLAAALGPAVAILKPKKQSRSNSDTIDVTVTPRTQPQKRVSIVAAEDLKNPKIAWPTILLFVTALAGASGSAYAGWKGKIHPVAAIAIQSICQFVLFTPAHDATHSAIGKGRYKWMNNLIGRVYGWTILAPFGALRYCHLQHHKNTNIEHHDPDMWASGGTLPRVFLPFFWMTQDLHYYTVYLPRIFTRPKAEVVESISTLFVLYGLVVYGFRKGYGEKIVLHWLLPLRLSVMMLAFSFDYVPHRPHKVDIKANPYLATTKIDGLFSKDDVNLDWLILFQNYHNIHHLYPTIPFYNYKKIWVKYEKELLVLGTPVGHFISTDPWFAKPRG
ncbi:fatty acid desaturase-domain-containing protein [Chytriomyces sp. MP71]|nr:fatty acid desaturase-domain-containing protein [Chytriomyces sp. MP71]